MLKERRTREQKIQASAGFEPTTFSFVKREFTTSKASEAGQPQSLKRSEILSQTDILASTRTDLFKTFILASGILIAEAVLYFFWQ